MRSRPLTKAGRRQAEAVAERLGRRGRHGLWSSPYVRCVQTLEPLAGQARPADPRRAAPRRGRAALAVLELLAEVRDGAVLCSHGDVIPELLDALVRRGTTVLTDTGLAQGGDLDPRRARRRRPRRHGAAEPPPG